MSITQAPTPVKEDVRPVRYTHQYSTLADVGRSTCLERQYNIRLPSRRSSCCCLLWVSRCPDARHDAA